MIVDGNKHKLDVCILIKEDFGIEKQKGNLKVQEKYGVKVVKIKILMTEFDYSVIAPDDYKYVLSNDMGLPIKLDKVAYYKNDSNCLTIWKDGLPIYENNNGKISDDEVALADCLCKIC